MQGWRINMEDAHIIKEVELAEGERGLLVGVFDGHGGEEVAKYAEDNFEKIFLAEMAKNADSFKETLTNTFMIMDAQLDEYEYSESQGATSCVVLITPSKIYCANAGDSRAILAQDNGKAVEALSYDHKPQNTMEEARIQNAGHYVCMDRVDG